MEDALDYKTAKEGFVANQNGSTLNHINLISLVALTSLSFYSSLRVRSHLLPLSPSLASFITQFVLLVAPLLVAVTIAADPSGWDAVKVNLLFTGAAVAVYIGTKEHIARSRNSLPHSTKVSTKVDQTDNENKQNASGKIPFLPAVTTWRAHMMLMTSLCILAVDFPVFPRELAKCETFGVSLVCRKPSPSIQLPNLAFSDGPRRWIFRLRPRRSDVAAPTQGSKISFLSFTPKDHRQYAENDADVAVRYRSCYIGQRV